LPPPGTRKEQRDWRDTPREQSVIAEFNLKRGLAIAVFSGMMSGLLRLGSGCRRQPIRALPLSKAGTDPLWQGLPVLCVVLLGGFTTNLIWCGWLILKQPIGWGEIHRPTSVHAADADGAPPTLLAQLCCWRRWAARSGTSSSSSTRWARARWGGTASPPGHCTWPSIILFSTLWGFALKEWAGVRGGTRLLVWLGIGALLLSTVVIGVGNYLAA
jgi:L-rhamnose-H+ transport protein